MGSKGNGHTGVARKSKIKGWRETPTHKKGEQIVPYISNKDMDNLIKIEHLIGRNMDVLFTRWGEKHYFTDKDGEKRLDYQEKINPKTGVSTDDFNTYWNFVERVIQDRKKASEMANKWNKEHPERHRELNKKSAKRVAKKRKR